MTAAQAWCSPQQRALQPCGRGPRSSTGPSATLKGRGQRARGDGGWAAHGSHLEHNNWRQGEKRRAFPRINEQIIEVADTGDCELIMATVEANLKQMNLVNLSTALHRMAKLANSQPEASAILRQHAVMWPLVETVSEHLREALIADSAMPQCQALSNIVWSLATLRVVNRTLLWRAAKLACAHLAEFKDFELASMLWGLAKLSEQDPTTLACAAELFELAVTHVAQRLEGFTFRCLVMLAWALAAGGQHDAVLFRNIGARMVLMIHTSSCHELSSIAWAFGTAGVRHDKLFSDIAQKGCNRLPDFKTHELVSILGSFARNGFFHKAFVENAAVAAAALEPTSAQLCSLVCAIAQLRPHHPATRSAILVLLPHCLATVGSFAAPDLLSLAVALAKCFWESEDRTGGLALVGQPPPPLAVDFMQVAGPAIEGCLKHLPIEAACEEVSEIPSAAWELMHLRHLGAWQTSRIEDSSFHGGRCQHAAASRGYDHPRFVQAPRATLAAAGGSTGLAAETGVPSIAVSSQRHIVQSSAEATGDSSEQAAPAPTGLAVSTPDDASGDEAWSRSMPTGYSVKNTFVHFDGSTVSERRECNGMDLAPALDVIPQEVPAERLAKLRAEYQLFRAGNAFCTRSEIRAIVP